MQTHPHSTTVIGAGLAGSEAAWQIVQRGIPVTLIEMRPEKTTKAHKTGKCAELVCSNSLRGAAMTNAVGVLKAELTLSGSLIMQAAEVARVPAGGALAVDRDVFSDYIDNQLRNHPLVTFVNQEVSAVPEHSQEHPVIIATGPLTSPQLVRSIQELTGETNLAFFDAISPIIFEESIDYTHIFRQSRYDKGEDDYLNIPLNKEQYLQFIADVAAAEKYTGNEAVETDSPEQLRPFEGCMPIEDMIERGPDTLRYGPFKPVGLTNPNSDIAPYAVMQLRQDDKAGTIWSMVGMQTRMKRADQLRVFCSLPGLQNAEFVRFGSVHRNTFINSPACLDATLEFRGRPGLFFAGQMTGVEGYVESTAGGLLAGINAARVVQQKSPVVFPPDTTIGALHAYISDTERKNFQPMNISFGLVPSFSEIPKREGKRRIGKKERRERAAQQALDSTRSFLREHELLDDLPQA